MTKIKTTTTLSNSILRDSKSACRLTQLVTKIRAIVIRTPSINSNRNHSQLSNNFSSNFSKWTSHSRQSLQALFSSHRMMALLRCQLATQYWSSLVLASIMLTPSLAKIRMGLLSANGDTTSSLSSDKCSFGDSRVSSSPLFRRKKSQERRRSSRSWSDSTSWTSLFSSAAN